MKTFYRVVCDEHKHMCKALMIENHDCSLEDSNKNLAIWLKYHHGCNLRLVHSEQALDQLLCEYDDYIK